MTRKEKKRNNEMILLVLLFLKKISFLTLSFLFFIAHSTTTISKKSHFI